MWILEENFLRNSNLKVLNNQFFKFTFLNDLKKIFSEYPEIIIKNYSIEGP